MLKVCLARNVSAILLKKVQKHLKNKKGHSSSAFGFFSKSMLPQLSTQGISTRRHDESRSCRFLYSL